MTLLYAALAVVAGAGVLWLLTQLTRIRAAPRLAALLGLVAFWGISYPFGLIANTGGGVGLDALEARTLERAFRLVATACFVAFIMATPVSLPSNSSSDGHRRWSFWGWQAGVLAATIIALILDAAHVPAHLRAPLAELAAGSGGAGAPTGSPTVALFFLIENLYYGAAFVIATVWASQHLRRRGLPVALRLGLAMLWSGCIILVTATLLLSSSVVVRWVGPVPPPMLTTTGVALMSLGLLLLVMGLAAPSATSSVATLHILKENRATARQLEPLWEQLHAAFPRDDDAPGPPTGARYLAAAQHAPVPRLVSWLSRRYYRTLIDCLDGLYQLDPYLHAVASGDEAHSEDLPTGYELQAALQLRASGDYTPPAVAHTSRIHAARAALSPETHDAHVLVLLSQRLEEAQRGASGSTTASR